MGRATFRNGYGRRNRSERVAARESEAWTQPFSPTPGDLLDGLQPGLFQDRVFVFTPHGDVEDLPAGSTPIDVAYAIGTETGHRCFAARVNYYTWRDSRAGRHGGRNGSGDAR